MVEYPIVVYEPRCWTVYVHVVPKEIRSSPDRDDYYDKYYVGITKRGVDKRWGKNGYEYKTQVFGLVIQKYGWENIKHIVICTKLTRLIACEFEKYLIELLQSHVDSKHGYNITKGGEGFLGFQKYGQDNSFYGKHHTKETKEKMSKNHWDNSGENNYFYGKTHTKETRDKISSILKEYYKNHPEKINHTPLTEERKRQIGIQHSKPVYVFDMQLNMIGEFGSIIEAADTIGITRRVAETIVNKVRKFDKDYIIRFKSEISNIAEFQKLYKPKIKE